MSKILELSTFVFSRNYFRGLASTCISQLIHNPCENVFCLKLSDGTASIQYQKEGDVYNLKHTLVPDVFKGKGVGTRIAKEVLDYCKNNKIPVRISCEFLGQYIQKHSEYNSVIVDSEKINK